MDRPLRHLRALQAFDLAAATSNLSKAADALGVTHGAVSRQIKQLEDHLGVALLHRLSNGVEKTPEGERLHLSTRRAFAELSDGVRAVRSARDEQALTISLSASLATKWLVPSLAAFRSAYPGLSVFLDTNDDVVDLASSTIDVALRYGEPKWGNLFCELITREALIVVASPKLVAGQTLPLAAEAVVRLPLLYDEFNPGWDKWATASGIDLERLPEPAVRFGDSAVMIAAAIDGQGAALARRLLVQRDLEAGWLLRLDESVTPLERSLYFVCRKGDEDRGPVRSFRRWLFSSAVQEC